MKSFKVFERTVQGRFRGVINSGSHYQDGEACVLEVGHAALDMRWSDSPDLWPDIRSLNDAAWPNDYERTVNMTRLMEAVWTWSEWPLKRQISFVTAVALRTIREVLPIALEAVGMPENAQQCRDAVTLAPAAVAAMAAEAAAAARAEAAAEAAARKILSLACLIWIEESSSTLEEVANPSPKLSNGSD